MTFYPCKAMEGEVELFEFELMDEPIVDSYYWRSHEPTIYHDFVEFSGGFHVFQKRE